MNFAYFIIIIIVLVIYIISQHFKIREFRNSIISLKKNCKSQLTENVNGKESDIKSLHDDIRKQYNEKIVNMASIIYNFRSLASSLDKDDILRISSVILNKSVGAKKGYFFLKNAKKNETYCLRKFEFTKGDNKKYSELKLLSEKLTFKISETNALGYLNINNGIICREGLRTDINDIHLINKCPIKFEVIFSIVDKSQPVGAIIVEEFVDCNKEEISMEERQIIVSLGTILGVVLKNVQLLDMTRKDLISTKKLTEKEREMKLKLKEIFSKYTSEDLVEKIMDNFDSVKLGGEKRNMTVMFSDFKNFTEFSEKKDPEKVISILNKYLDSITKIIIKTNGNIDKFLGDGVMAFWGAPVKTKDHALQSVRAAYAIQKLISEMNIKYQDNDFKGLEMGIGINTGEMLIGNMGSSERLEYTVIGDAVNLASRIESLSRTYKYNIIISKSTYECVKKFFICESLGETSVKGKKQKVELFAVTGKKSVSKKPSK